MQKFETKLADLLGKDRGVFFPTGTSAQQAALHAHGYGLDTVVSIAPSGLAAAAAPPLVFVHWTSHLVFLDCLHDGKEQETQFKQRAAASLPGFEVRAFGSMSAVATFGDVEAALATLDLDDGMRNVVLVLELPQRMNGGGSMSYADLKSTAALCTEMGIKLHCDGARLWEVQPFYNVPLQELASHFDTVYVSFYKGVGALASAMLVGSQATIAAAAVWGKRRGADVFTRGPLAVSCEMELEAALASPTANFEARFTRLCQMVESIKALVKAADVEASIVFDPETPQSAMIHCYIKGDREQIEVCHAKVQAETGVKLWNHFRGAGHPPFPVSSSSSSERRLGSVDEWQYFEWSCGPGNVGTKDAHVEAGWTSFLHHYTSLV